MRMIMVFASLCFLGVEVTIMTTTTTTTTTTKQQRKGDASLFARTCSSTKGLVQDDSKSYEETTDLRQAFQKAPLLLHKRMALGVVKRAVEVWMDEEQKQEATFHWRNLGVTTPGKISILNVQVSRMVSDITINRHDIAKTNIKIGNDIAKMNTNIGHVGTLQIQLKTAMDEIRQDLTDHAKQLAKLDTKIGDLANVQLQLMQAMNNFHPSATEQPERPGQKRRKLDQNTAT